VVSRRFTDVLIRLLLIIADLLGNSVAG
jgi:hypothetical protein